MLGTDLLHSQNIISALCQHLSPGPLLSEDEYTANSSKALKERRKHQQALSRLARVCRTVSEFALDELWRSIDDITHILYAFNAYDREKCMFIEALNDADKAKFNAYARRVRELHVGKIERVHATVWVVLVAHWGPHGPLLPGLERMTGLRIDSNSLCYTLILSPTTKHLSLQVNRDAEPGIVGMVVDAARPMLTSLVHLSINGVLLPSPSAIPFWKLSQLHRLHVAPPVDLTHAIIRALGSFAHLSQLELKIKSMPAIGDDEARVRGFTNLRTLSLKGSLDDVCALMVATKPPVLESLNIETNRVCPVRGGSSSSIERLRGTLPPSLRTFSATLTCETCSGYRGSCSSFPNSEVLLSPLLAMDSLRCISFSIGDKSFRLADAALAEAENAWPQLAQFKIITPRPVHSTRDGVTVIPPYPYPPGSRPMPTPKHPSVKTLAIFAHAHPNLEQLVLPTIDLDAVPELDSVPLLEHGLRHFGICALEEDVGLMHHARALDMLFPRLDLDYAYKLSAMGQDQHEKDRNAELQLLLLALQTGRTSEPDRRERAAREGSASVDPHTMRLVESEDHFEQSAIDEARSSRPPDSDDEDSVSFGDWGSVTVLPHPYVSIPVPLGPPILQPPPRSLK
ncbi:hypothetical protein GY45DRAFT_754306 [Cubamyces sp. BRFM 1775]|nr:hypothetical protein GY45DRAFT_754306 [Cubamyces sp. BRFM 1775]